MNQEPIYAVVSPMAKICKFQNRGAETKVVSLINKSDSSATVVLCVPASLISAGLEVLVP